MIIKNDNKYLHAKYDQYCFNFIEGYYYYKSNHSLDILFTNVNTYLF